MSSKSYYVKDIHNLGKLQNSQPTSRQSLCISETIGHLSSGVSFSTAVLHIGIFVFKHITVIQKHHPEKPWGELAFFFFCPFWNSF